MKKISILVEELALNGNLEISKDPNIVIANAQILFKVNNLDFEETLSKNNKGIITFLPAGKFICYFNIKKDISKTEMLLFNTNNEIDISLDIANCLFKDQPHLINLFMQTHEKWSSRYTDKWDLIEMRLI